MNADEAWDKPVTADDVRGYFHLNGWSIVLGNGIRSQSYDPFVPLADWIASGVEHSIEAAIRAETPATDLTTRTLLLPFLRHGATCALQAVRDNPPWDDLCTCGLRERWLAVETPATRTDALDDFGPMTFDSPSGPPGSATPPEVQAEYPGRATFAAMHTPERCCSFHFAALAASGTDR